jgi:hypothetical protein
MITITVTCSRCESEHVEHDPPLPLALPDGWRFTDEMLCPDCANCDPGE